MATQLQRDLGLYAVLTISLGAMIGSGIFVLPGLAAAIAGPGVIFAYFLAGLIVLPAALSKSEMATAMPQAGGTYLYIDRAMGPLMGTVAGIGVWFSLVFKSAFALVGLGAYLNIFASASVKPVAVALAAVLVVLNILGVRQSGRFQAVVVSIVLGTLIVLVVTGVGSVESVRYEPLLDGGLKSLLSATGLVFVAYAGVTKVAGVAEEVKRPARNIPRGILASIVLMMALYPALVFVIVGVTPVAELAKDVTPMATAAGQFAPTWAVDAVAIVAVLALVSMANAGLLASSRYPFAMSRNRLAPAAFSIVNERTATPVTAIMITGGTMILLIVFFPLIELAKLASAFTLLAFTLVNLALIAFRESKLDWYRPPFRSPLYPWLQIAGIAGALVLVSQMGVVPIVGAIVIVAGGALWYEVFGRSRASRESAGWDALRIRARERVLRDTDTAIHGPAAASVLLAIRREVSDARLHDLIRLGTSVLRDGRELELLRIGSDRAGDGGVHDTATDEERHFQNRVATVAAGIDVDAHFVYVGGRDWRRQLLEYTEQRDIQLVMAEAVPGSGIRRSFAHDMQWLSDHVPSDFLFLGNRYLDEIDDIAILGSGSPLDPLKVDVANRIAAAEGASLRFLHVLPAAAPGREVVSMRDYHRRLAGLIDVPGVSDVIRADDIVPALVHRARGADLVLLGASRSRLIFVGDLVDRIGAQLDAPVLLARAHRAVSERPLADRVLERFLE